MHNQIKSPLVHKHWKIHFDTTVWHYYIILYNKKGNKNKKGKDIHHHVKTKNIIEMEQYILYSALKQTGEGGDMFWRGAGN